MPKAVKGVLIECEPAIKSIIVLLDRLNHDYIIEELDERHLVVKYNMVDTLKAKLEQHLSETYQPEEALESDKGEE